MGTVITTRELVHGTTYVGRGRELDCTATDADYYVTRHMASYKTADLAAGAPPAPAPTPAPPPPAPAPAPAPMPAPAPEVAVAVEAETLDPKQDPKDESEPQVAPTALKAATAVAFDDSVGDNEPAQQVKAAPRRASTTRKQE